MLLCLTCVRDEENVARFVAGLTKSLQPEAVGNGETGKLDRWSSALLRRECCGDRSSRRPRESFRAGLAGTLFHKVETWKPGTEPVGRDGENASENGGSELKGRGFEFHGELDIAVDEWRKAVQIRCQRI